MARKISSKFGATEELFDFSSLDDCVRKKESTQEVYHEQEVQEVRIPVTKYGTSQGKKGMKMKRINMGFSDATHFYLQHESRKRGISISKFVNEIVEDYMKNNPFF